MGHIVEKGGEFAVLGEKRFGRPDDEPDGVSLDPGDFRRVIVSGLDRPQKGFLPEIFQIAARNPLLDPDRVDQARILQQKTGPGCQFVQGKNGPKMQFQSATNEIQKGKVYTKSLFKLYTLLLSISV